MRSDTPGLYLEYALIICQGAFVALSSTSRPCMQIRVWLVSLVTRKRRMREKEKSEGELETIVGVFSVKKHHATACVNIQIFLHMNVHMFFFFCMFYLA